MTQTEANPIDTFVEKADVLFQARDQFEKEMLARTNKALYEILGGVLELFLAVKAKDCIDDTLKVLKARREERGMKVQRNTAPVTVLIRYVFNSDRKRAHAYSKTLLAAMDENVQPLSLADFIERNGGIEEIKRTKVLSPKAAERQQNLEIAISEVARNLATTRALGTVPMGNNKVDIDEDAQFAFLVARKQADGSLEVVAPVPRTTKVLEGMAMKIIAKKALEAEAKEKEVQSKAEEYSFIQAAAQAIPTPA
jgi:hypothetical protein